MTAYTALLKDYIGGGLYANIPSASSLGPTIAPNMSAYYFATDTGRVYSLASGDTAWQLVSGVGRSGFFDLSPGIPASLATLGDGTKFTWTQNGTKGANVKQGSTATSMSLAGWTVSKTSGSAWEVAVCLLHNNVGAEYYGDALGLYNSSTSKLITFNRFQGQYNAGEFTRWNSYSSRHDIPNSYPNFPWAQGWLWLHMKDDGSGNIQLGESKDGANPVWNTTTTTADWVTSYDHIFFGGAFDGVDGTNVAGASTSVLCYDPSGNTRLVGI